MNKFISILTSILGLALITSSGAAPYLLEGMGYWQALGGVFGGFVLINIKGDEADTFISTVMSLASMKLGNGAAKIK